MLDKLKKILTNLLDQFLLVYFVFLLGLFITDFSFIFKEGISNLSVHSIIFVFLLGARWYLDKVSFNNSLLIKLLKSIAKLDDKRLLFLIFIFLIFILFSIGLFRHLAFSSAGCDMGVTDQSIWNTTQGRILFSSLDGKINHLGAHFEPVLLLIVPFYFIWPNILVLVILQALAIGTAVIPLYLIAKNRLKSRALIFAFIFAYFLSRPLRGVGLLDFHTDTFLIPLSFISYYLLLTRRHLWAVIAMLLMLGCKENATILVFAYGIFTITYLKRYRLGVSLLALAITWWLLVTDLIMPHFAYTADYPYLKWLPFGPTYSENISAVIRNPGLLANLFFSQGKAEFYTKLFAPLGMLSLISPAHYVLFLLPLIFQVIGSVNHAGMVDITAHYPAHTLPFIFISAIFGAGSLIDFLKNKGFIKKFGAGKISNFLAALIILLSLGFFGKSDGHKLAKFIYSANSLNSGEIRQALKKIPPDASVCAVHRIVPHLTHRKYIYIWENSQDTRYLVEYIVLHRRLIERDKKRFDQMIIELRERGYQEVHSDKSGDLFIFLNPGYEKESLENRQSKMIPL